MRRLAALPALLLLALALQGCSHGKPALADQLSHYTDSGDGCQQAVTAITYADHSLRSAGQEQHQKFGAAVRSNLTAVAGTIDLEVRDFPSKTALDQARKVGDLAEQTAALGARGQRRVTLLREYRREAAQLVIDCGEAVKGL